MFDKLIAAVSKQFAMMSNYELYKTNQVSKNDIWDIYLTSFPAGSDPVYKNRSEHDCNSCKSFIRAVGNLIVIIDGKLTTIWDVQVPEPYQTVVNALSAWVKSCEIENFFLSTEDHAGVEKTLQHILGSTQINTWIHLNVRFKPTNIETKDGIGPKLSEYRSNKDVFLRSLNEITLDSLDTVLDLISQNSLYRGEEHTFVLNSFRALKIEFLKLRSPELKNFFAWSKLKTVPVSVSKIRNTSIGTLLVDLSGDTDLDIAVKSFESKVAPSNYKRPTALVTKAMIAKAKETIEELGFTSALERRYATLDDITINNILFANRETRKKMDIFDEVSAEVTEQVKNFDKVEEVSIDDFISKILPKAESLEIMFDNNHLGNLVSLVAPVNATAKNMFKWDNNFSWSYTGEVTDSIKERVKQAGGKVDGEFRASLSWYNYDDLDLHLIEPNGNEIYYGSKSSYTSKGNLDVDMNAGGGLSRTPVENITYPFKHFMKEGIYNLKVHQYSKRETTNPGFEVELEFNGIIHTFTYNQPVNKNILVAKFKYSHKEGITFIESLDSKQASKTAWGITTQTFQKVNVLAHSPNYWDAHSVGNKHYFFMLDHCVNEGQARGFYNEFLCEDLNKHRKVLEIIGSRLKTEKSDQQLSGLGFSSTQRNILLCRVKGTFSRVIKINF